MGREFNCLHMRILIIEDDDDISRLLVLSLEAEYFIVDTAFDGESGSFLGRTNEYDLVLLDNLLPKKNGLAVCQELRKQGKSMPILILSGVTDTSAKIDFLDAGADDYVTKPFVTRELIARIRALLRRPCSVLHTVLQVDNLTLDVDRHSVQRAGIEIQCTRKEFILLEYFMRNKGVVVSRAAIMNHVWDMYADPFSNTVEAHILSIRKKICLLCEKKLIHTVSGCGYVMDIRE